MGCSDSESTAAALYGTVRRVKVSSHKTTPPLMSSIGQSTIARRRCRSESPTNLRVTTADRRNVHRRSGSYVKGVTSVSSPGYSCILRTSDVMRVCAKQMDVSKDDLALIVSTSRGCNSA